MKMTHREIVALGRDIVNLRSHLEASDFTLKTPLKWAKMRKIQGVYCALLRMECRSSMGETRELAELYGTRDRLAALAADIFERLEGKEVNREYLDRLENDMDSQEMYPRGLGYYKHSLEKYFNYLEGLICGFSELAEFSVRSRTLEAALRSRCRQEALVEARKAVWQKYHALRADISSLYS